MNHDQQPGAAAPAITAKQISAIYLALMTMLALSGLDQSIVATALPRIGSDLGGIAHLSWVVTGYALASTAVMPLYGKLSDQYGRKPLIYFAVITFLLGSALCGLAQSMNQLIAFRVVQGIGAGGFLPLAQIVIGDFVPPAERGRRQGSIAAIFAVTTVVGPVLGGFLTDLLSWHWIFFINMPVGALALWLFARSMPAHTRISQHKIDYLGSALLVGAVTAALLVLTLGGSEWPWDAPQVVYLSLGAGAMLVWLLVHVHRVPEPVLPPDLFHHRVFNLGSAVLALAFMGMMGVSVFLPMLFQMVMHIGPAESGLLTMPLMIGMVSSSIVNGRLMARPGFDYQRMQVLGLALALLAMGALAWGVREGIGLLLIEPALFMLGAGLGLVSPNMTIMVQQSLPPARSGVGTAMLGFFRSLGGLVGVAGSGAILAQHLQGRAHVPALYQQAIAHIFVAAAVMVGLALAALILLPRSTPAPHDKLGRAS